LKIPRRKQRGIFDPNGDESICIRASNPRPKGRGMRRACVFMEEAMENGWGLGVFVISVLSIVGLFIQSIRSIDRNLKNRQARIREMKSL